MKKISFLFLALLVLYYLLVVKQLWKRYLHLGASSITSVNSISKTKLEFKKKFKVEINFD